MSYYNGKKVVSLIVINAVGVAKKTYSESFKTGDQPTPPTPQLEAPTISLSGDTLSISSVPNATSYDIYVNNTLETNIGTTTLDLTTLSLTTGTYSIKVKAKATNYLDSEFSNSVNYVISPQLDTPTISLSGNTLSIEEVENAEYYDIYVDDVLEESVPVVSSFAHIYINKYNYSSGGAYYKLNDGSQIAIPSSADVGDDPNGNLTPSELQDFQTKSVDVTGVSKLEVMGDNADCSYMIYDTNGTLIAYGNCSYAFVDITQYLQEGYFVHISIWD